MGELPGVRLLAKEARGYAKRLDLLLRDAQEGQLQRIDLVIVMAELHELVRSVVEADHSEEGP